MSSKKIYTLACHCQTHVYRLTLPVNQLEKEGAVCDCSWCLKRRIIWAFVPRDSLMHHRGAGVDGTQELNEYRFATKTATHKVCLTNSPARTMADRALVLWEMRDLLVDGA